MHAIVAHAAGDLRVEPRPDAADPGPGEVSVDVVAGGICGSDLHYYRHGGFGAVRLREPMVLGHEAAGRVRAVGGGVADLAPGDLVAINPSEPCLRCEECLRGHANECLDMVFSGSAMRFPHVQGLFRQTVTVPRRRAARVDGPVEPQVAALCEPFAVCLHAVARAGSLLGRTVLVMGCGPIGCLTVVAARLAGAARIVACDVVPAPLAIAATLGADACHDTAARPAALDGYRAGKGRIDVAFDCSGHPAAVAAALSTLRPRGRLVVVGLGGAMEVDVPLVVTREIEVLGSFRFDVEFDQAVALLSSGRVDLAPLVTHRIPFDRAVEAFDLAGDRNRAMKVALTF